MKAYQQARAQVAGVRALVRVRESTGGLAGADHTVAVSGLVAELEATSRLLTPDWWGLDVRTLSSPMPPLGVQPPTGGPMLLHVGVAWLTDQQWFSVVVPLLGTGGGHLTIDANLRSRPATALLRAVLLRLLASMPVGQMEVRLVDGAGAGAAFAAFQPLIDSGGLPSVVIDSAGMSTVLAEAEAHVQRAQTLAAAGRSAEQPYLVILGEVPDARSHLARITALAHAGPAARLCLILAGWPPAAGGQDLPVLDHAFAVAVDGQHAHLADPPRRAVFSEQGTGMPVRVTVDDDPDPGAIEGVCRALAAAAQKASVFTFADLLPAELWTGSSVTGLETVIGRAGREEVVLAFNDETPHWMIAGRSGSGKTVLQLDLLYGLAARYPPSELALYLLDFKEGVSFTEFTPTPRDESWIPHARAVGIESDIEYGIAVLQDLVAEMSRRSVAMKRHGVTTLPALRAVAPDLPMPRIVAVIDEFHVLLSGPTRQAATAVALLEDLARKGRSYGIHLVLASQTISGVEALYSKRESIFGQFPLRLALAGASGILEPGNTTADGLTVGQAVVNTAAGLAGHDRVIRFPDAHAAGGTVAELRTRLWQMRAEGSRPPHVFAGWAEQHIDDVLPTLSPQVRHRRLLVGRHVDVAGSVAGFELGTAPGRHLAVVGASPVGADILHATVTALARQHPAGSVRFALAPLVSAADDAVNDLLEELRVTGHPATEITQADLPATLAELADSATNTYLVLFGADAASGTLTARDPVTRRTALDDLHTVLAAGPGRGVHVLGWWRGVKRLAEDLGGSAGRDNLACLVALNVTGSDLATLTGDALLDWQPRPNRALLLDRHEGTSKLIVPFVRPGRHDDHGAPW